MYQTYDVTKALKQGQKNALGAWLSEGWWSGNSTFSGENWNFFGDRQSLLSKLVITYADGTEQISTSKPAEWKLFSDGPVRYGSFFQGEVYDATKEALVKIGLPRLMTMRAGSRPSRYPCRELLIRERLPIAWDAPQPWTIKRSNLLGKWVITPVSSRRCRR